jgi:regulatory protein YycI of two-component signal transduction system YycFG
MPSKTQAKRSMEIMLSKKQAVRALYSYKKLKKYQKTISCPKCGAVINFKDAYREVPAPPVSE